MNKEISLTKSVGWLLLAKMVGFVLSFLLPILIYQTLSKSDIGIYQQVFLVIVTVSGVLPFGVSLSAYYFLSREKERQPFYIFNILIFNFAVGGLACLVLNIYPQILQDFTKDAEMATLAPQIGFVIWLWVFSSFFETAVIANQETRLATIFIISAQLSKAVLMISAVHFFGTVEAMLNAVTIQAIFETTALFIYLNSRFKGFWTAFDKSLFIEHLKYALPFGFAGLLLVIQTEAHNYFVSYYYSKEDVAVYRAGCFQLPLLVLFYESISFVMIPRMSRLQLEGKKREMVEVTARAMGKIALVYFPVYVFFFITADTLITTLFTKNFVDSIPIFLINITLLPSYVFIIDPLIRAFESLGKFILKLRILIVFGLLLTLYFGIQHFDLRGVIAVVVIASLIERFISLTKIYQTIGFKLSDFVLLKNVGKTAICSVLAGIPVYFLYTLGNSLNSQIGVRINSILSDSLNQNWADVFVGASVLALTAMIFIPIYLIFLNLLGVICKEEKGQFLNTIERIKRKFFLLRNEDKF